MSARCFHQLAIVAGFVEIVYLSDPAVGFPDRGDAVKTIPVSRTHHEWARGDERAAIRQVLTVCIDEHHAVAVTIPGAIFNLRSYSSGAAYRGDYFDPFVSGSRPP